MLRYLYQTEVTDDSLAEEFYSNSIRQIYILFFFSQKTLFSWSKF